MKCSNRSREYCFSSLSFTSSTKFEYYLAAGLIRVNSLASFVP